MHNKILEKYIKIFQIINEKNIFSKNQDQYSKLFESYIFYIQKFMQLSPDKILQIQFDFWINQIKIIDNVQNKFNNKAEIDDLYYVERRDNRFKDQNWQDNILFNYIKQSYIHFGQWIKNSTNLLDIEDKKSLKKIHFLVSQFLDAMSPTNFIITNPEVIKETINTKGENLLNGMDNFIHDLLQTDNQFSISTTCKENKFELGKNLATTKGRVILQNEMMELIHYNPSKENHYSIPLLIVPPCINKYYILDLQPQNSFIKWLIDQGFNIYLISWKNPNAEYSDKNFEDYMIEGPVAAIAHISKYHDKINSLGYCIGGTILSCAISYLESQGKSNINNATFLTTLLDYREIGDLSVFINEIDTSKAENSSVFSGESMSATFNILKANEMIWSFYVNNYLLGKEPDAFDILYWNNDYTHLPKKMHNFYIENIYQKNLLSKKQINLAGQQIDLSNIKCNCYFLSCKDDHIAPWRSTYLATKIIKSNVTFVLAASGHVAGVINHPDKNKYCYWTNSNTQHTSSKNWLKGASRHEGSWWNHWILWLAQNSGELEKSTIPNYPIITQAPGIYVTQ